MAGLGARSAAPGGSLGAPEAATLYGINTADDGVSRIDPRTGAVTFLGPLSPDPDDFPVPVSLAADPADGALYAWNNAVGVNGLVAVDRATGLGTSLGPAVSPTTFGELFFGPDGELYGVGSGFFRIDRATGEPELVSDLRLGLAAATFLDDGSLIGAQSGGLLFTGIDLASETWQADVFMRLQDGTRFGGPPNNPNTEVAAQIQAFVRAPSGQVLGSAFLFATEEVILYEYDRDLGLILLDGQPPGSSGSAVDPATGFTYFFLASGEIVLSLDDPDLVPEGDTLTRTIEHAERHVLFELDPQSGIVSKLRDLDGGATMQGLAFVVPEPALQLLLGAGLFGVSLVSRSCRAGWRSSRRRGPHPRGARGSC